MKDAKIGPDLRLKEKGKGDMVSDPLRILNIRRSETLFLAFFMGNFFKKITFLEASACTVSIAMQNHSWNCDIFDDDEKINACCVMN